MSRDWTLGSKAFMLLPLSCISQNRIGGSGGPFSLGLFSRGSHIV